MVNLIVQSQVHIYNINVSGITTGEQLVNKIVTATGGDPGGHTLTKLEPDKTNPSALLVHDARPTQSTNHSSGRGVLDEGVMREAKATEEIKYIDIQAGASANPENIIRIHLPNITTVNMDIDTINLSTVTGARKAIAALNDALAYVSEKRSQFGAYQNRLEHTIKNLDNVVENTQSAESMIRDTDMATEMVKFTKDNILAQVGQSMLAQANQSNQGVLSLLGG